MAQESSNYCASHQPGIVVTKRVLKVEQPQKGYDSSDIEEGGVGEEAPPDYDRPDG